MNRYFAVINTNVIVSAMLKKNTPPDAVLRECLCGCIIPVFNDEILREYKYVLSRKKFNFPKDDVNLIMSWISKRGINTDALPIDEILPDPKDRVFYEVTLESRKNHDTYLVTGNIKHFPDKRFVVTPREMIEIIKPSINTESF